MRKYYKVLQQSTNEKASVRKERKERKARKHENFTRWDNPKH
jgi:hypothetical protein